MSCKATPRPARRPPKVVRVAIDSLAFGGDGVGRESEGRVIFVAGTAPGDEVEARVVEEKKGFARAEVMRVLRSSELRALPPCPLYRDADCGGCQWQHVSVAAQQAAKVEIVRRALRHVCPGGAGVEPLRAPSPPYGWRRRARLRWRGGELGYLARRSHRLVDVPRCPQMEEPLERALVAVRARLVPALGGGAGEIELLLGGGGDVHVSVDGRGARGPGAVAAANALLGEAGIAGVLLRDPEGEEVVGAAEIDLELAHEARPFLARADLFAQVSAPGNELLRRLVVEGAGDLTSARVLELYAGSGNFTRDLALGGAASVLAVEEVAPAAGLAARNLAGSSAVEFRPEAAEAAAAALAAAGARFDVVVVDPPRTGFGPGLAASLVALGPARIVYVSCDPNTLARDLVALGSLGGYRVIRATPVDLMPQTFHIETVAVIVR